jgi:ABC-2 type transport system ATP-binding protein
MSVIAFKNTTKRFKKFAAVNSINFEVQKGEIVGFVGPNGAGKTTTISMLLGFIKPSSGTVTLFSNVVTPQTTQKTHSRIGFASGDMALFDNLTGHQYLEYFANQYGKAQNLEALVQALSPKLTVPLKHLSRGNKQKIAIIGALQHQPEVIILDEPTSGLDPLMQKTFLELIEAEKVRGATIFMSSHILNEVAEVSDRVLFMRDGKIIINQPMAEIRGKEGKTVTVTSATQLQASELPTGSSHIIHDKKITKFHYTGTAEVLVRWLAKQNCKDFSVQNRTLDEIFEHLYENEASK